MGVVVPLDLKFLEEGSSSSEGKLRSWSTTCEPRKPQPPTTRTVPSEIVRAGISSGTSIEWEWWLSSGTFLEPSSSCSWMEKLSFSRGGRLESAVGRENGEKVAGNGREPSAERPHPRAILKHHAEPPHRPAPSPQRASECHSQQPANITIYHSRNVAIAYSIAGTVALLANLAGLCAFYRSGVGHCLSSSSIACSPHKAYCSQELRAHERRACRRCQRKLRERNWRSLKGKDGRCGFGKADEEERGVLGVGRGRKWRRGGGRGA